MINLNPIEKRKGWYVLSGIIVGAALVCLVAFGLPFGIDFQGGSLMEVRFETSQEVSAVREFVKEKGYDAVVQETQDQKVLMRLPALPEADHQALLAALGEKFGKTDEMRFDSIGPVIGSELKKKSALALLVSLALIVAYIAWMFRKVSEPVASWKYGVLTIVAGLHDILIPLGVFAVLGRSQLFQIDTAFVAAILTILGYSINDTIVVFDRTRENLSREGGADLEGTVKKSLRQTYSRSINTGLTTILALVAVFIFGGETTRGFALALIIGILAGTYSSIFLATPLLVTWHKWSEKRAQ